MAAIAKGPGARGDDELARAAVAGEGQAFAELYDRHEQRVYGFCLRLLGNPADAADATQETFMRLLKRLPALDGRELNFVAYVFTAARHACYDIIQARKRVELSGEEIEASGPEPGAIEEDPERAAMLAATRELTEQAHARLPERQREVLALRELEGLSYEEIGEVLELKPNAVAQLISRARIKLAELVRGDALESVAGATPDCDRALPLLARGQDSQTLAGEDGNWLFMHLRDCAVCRVRESTMQEAGVSYRSLAPIVPLVWLRQATIARAAELVGADWSELAHAHAGAGSRTSNGAGQGGGGGGSDGSGSGAGGRGSGAGRSGGAVVSRGAALFSLDGVGLGERFGLDSRRRRAGLVLLAACLLALVLFVGSIARDGKTSSSQALTPAPVGAATTLPRSARKGARKRVVHREDTVRRVLPGGQVVSVKVPVGSMILAPATAPSSSGGTETAHRKAHHRAVHSSPSTTPAPPLTTTTPATTTTAPAPTPTTPATSTPAPTQTTPTTTAPTTPTTTNPNAPPTEINPNAPGTLSPNTPAR
ncbi:MAG: sigma-70 family RNA polymerase sigma factor [Solirubrobacteraceae bacterium]